MASSSAATPETPITLKINFDGVTRRVKLPLRDLGASTFEDRLRHFLHIPLGTKTVFERYSDSAASYVVLDPRNISVYKQLYRAAKAKQKLKLRVSTSPEPKPELQLESQPEAKEEPETESEVKVEAGMDKVKVPKHVTVEDEPEADCVVKSEEAPVASTSYTVRTPAAERKSPSPSPATTPAAILDTVSAPQKPEDFPEFIKQWKARGMPRIHLRIDDNGVEVIDFTNPAFAADPYLFSNATGSYPHPFLETFAGAMRQTNIDALEALKAEEAKSTPIPEPKEKETPVSGSRPSRRPPFTVCCNSCDRSIPDAHFHCSTCDDGDFDLCQNCVDQGITCYDDNHWLIKRTIKDGQITYSTTHVAPKSNKAASKPVGLLNPLPLPSPSQPLSNAIHKSIDRLSLTPSWAEKWAAASAASTSTYNSRTCNCCVLELPEHEFLHCTTCEDFDLCKHCFAKNQHGHHPKHGFTSAVPGTTLEAAVSSRLKPGRDVSHNAICDGCDKYIRGVRYKCLDCPDWDYCSECVQNAGFIHPSHRFAALYEPIPDRPYRSTSRSTHIGICCDGPLCSNSRGGPKYIVGERYKCAVCHDTDFCASCEASPANTHNKTHPLIKFKTPVRHVSVTTTGEHEDGQRLPAMGDRFPRQRMSHRSTETVPYPSLVVNTVQTVVDVKPTEPQQPIETKAVKKEEQDEKVVLPQQPIVEETPDLVAIFKHDTVEDGTVFPPNHTFEQTWVLKNNGKVAWPAGCSVKFVGGDYMGAVDPKHPAGVHELVSASESTVCYNRLQPGQEFPFTVLMRTPDREGKVISYWRVTTSDGIKFGHKLWCDVTVQSPPKVKEEPILDSKVPDLGKSQVIVPKLDHESPASSVHSGKTHIEAMSKADTVAPFLDENEDDFEDCAEDETWAEESDEGFLTDEEYDILDASDEEYLTEQQQKVTKK